MSRIVNWFSCGAASAVASKMAITRAAPDQEVVTAYCQIREEHPDNMRFLKDCEEWLGQEIIILGNDKYSRSIYEVFWRTRFLKGPSGARCTGELKKAVRHDFQKPNDLLVMGYTVGEEGRLDRFLAANNDARVWPILQECGISHSDCLAMIERAGIELPVMYKLGYRNNNCIGCVKGEAGYWNKIRVDFPDVFKRMSDMERLLGRTVCKIEKGGKILRVPLKELPPEQGDYPNEPDIDCSIFCHLEETKYRGSA